MTLHLPTCPCSEQVAYEISFARADMKEDAAQAAWVAHLEGTCELKAVRRFLTRERRALRKPMRLIEAAKRQFGERGERL